MTTMMTMSRRHTRVYAGFIVGLMGTLLICTRIWYTGTITAMIEGGLRFLDSSVDHYKIQAARKEILSERCHDYKNLTNNILYKTYPPKLYYLPEYNMTLCKADKAGGTFLKKFMSLLRDNSSYWSADEEASRLDTHLSAVNLVVYFDNPSWRHSRIITAARNPYTRLYSAYVDKIMIPSVTGPLRQGDKCFFDITFEEFLKLVIYNNDHGIINSHWTPIYFQCRPCEYEQSIIFKQETFNDDLHHVLDTFNIGDGERKAVQKLMGRDLVKWTIKTVVREVMVDVLALDFNNKTLTCIGWVGILQKLWRSFQIQGYIDRNVPLHFRYYIQPNSYKNMTVFLDTVFDAIDRYPMTPSKAKSQRSNFITDAFKTISPEVIGDIKRIFMADFQLFGYSLDPPK